MSDPRQKTQADPHPAHGHRTPREIAEDEAGPIGEPNEDVVGKKASAETPPRDPSPRRAPLAPDSKRRGKRG
jgi:hypothetical protein